MTPAACACRPDPRIRPVAREACEAAGQDPDEPIHVAGHPRWWAFVGFAKHVAAARERGARAA